VKYHKEVHTHNVRYYMSLPVCFSNSCLISSLDRFLGMFPMNSRTFATDALHRRGRLGRSSKLFNWNNMAATALVEGQNNWIYWRTSNWECKIWVVQCQMWGGDSASGLSTPLPHKNTELLEVCHEENFKKNLS